MRLEGFECDGCGKNAKLDKDAVGWFDLAEVVLATRKDQPRWQFCSPMCLAIFSMAFVPSEAKEEPAGSLLEKWKNAISGGTIDEQAPHFGQYL